MSTDHDEAHVTAPTPDVPPVPPAAVHRRSLIIDSYPLGLEHVTVAGRLTDVEPWDAPGRQVIHDMKLTVTVRLADLEITAAEAGMGSFPHAECPFIAPAFAQLEGLSVRRGFTRELRQRLGGVSGCAHLGELARAMGPAIVRTSNAVRRQQQAAAGLSAADHGLLPVGSCHVWAADGPGLQKVAAGWVPGSSNFPVPPVSHFTG